MPKKNVIKGLRYSARGWVPRRRIRTTVFRIWAILFIGLACCGEQDAILLVKTSEELRSPSCPSSAGLFPCEHGCARVQVDPTNCGGCGVRCEPGEICRLGICLSAGNSSAGVSDPGIWENRGPVIGGRLAAVDVSGSADDPLWIVGSPGGGVWSKLDSEASWSSPAAWGLGYYSAVHLERDVADSARLYLQTWNGLYVSTDNGEHWLTFLGIGARPGGLVPKTRTVDPKPFSQLMLDATNRLIIIGRPCLGIDYSFDGVNFTNHFPFIGGSDNPDNCIGNIAIDRVSKRVYFSTLHGVWGEPAHLYRSTSAWAPGAPCLTWESANSGLPENSVVLALVSTSTLVGNHLLAVLHPSAVTEVWRTTTKVPAWSLRSTISTSTERALVFNPSGNDVFLGGVRAYHSADLGLSWTQFTVENEHVDVRAFFPRLSTGMVYTVNDGANAYTTEWNLTRWDWAPGSVPTDGVGVEESGLRIWQVFFAGVVPPVDDSQPRRTWIGSMDNGILCSNDAGASGWTNCFWASDLISFQYSPSNPQRAYSWDAGTNALWRTDNARTTCIGWSIISGVPDPSYWHRNAMAVDPGFQDEIYLTNPNEMLRSTDGGATFESRPKPGGFSPTSIYVATGGILYAGTENGGIWRSLDDGMNWGAWGLNSGSPRAVLGFVKAGNTEWAATTSGLYRKVGVGSWTRVTGGGGYIVNDVAVDPNCPTRVYAALGFMHGIQQHRGGIQFSSDNGDSWSSITSGLSLHQSPVADVEVDQLNSRYVYAASYGTGFWHYDWGSSLPPCNP